jgi:lactoylglutathione lyase
MHFAHTMVRVTDLDKAMAFYGEALGLVETRRVERPEHKYTLVFMAAPEDLEHARQHRRPEIELTYNYDPEEYTGGRNFGHLAFRVDNIYEYCAMLQGKGITINRPPRDGRIAFIRSPEGISIELIQKGEGLAPQEPWASMPNIGSW